MNTQTDLQSFLRDNEISREQWDSSRCDWKNLLEIANTHEKDRQRLEASSDYLANRLRNFDHVHYVRTRIKDTNHLLKKIIRKSNDKQSSDKYKNLNSKNYNKIITDLVGLRVLHLLKEDILELHSKISDTWKTSEKPIAYLRTGDDLLFRGKLFDLGMEISEHPNGYRSIHYIIESAPEEQAILAEIQIRTIFEEAWSEIDHRVNYPKKATNTTIQDLLSVLNRSVGAADEMGSIISRLDSHSDPSARNQETRSKEPEPDFLALPKSPPKPYSNPNLQGRATFNYSNNNGRYTIGSAEMAFDTMWSSASNTSIHVYSDAGNIESVAFAENTKISKIENAEKYDTSSRARTADCNGVVIWKNVHGYYLAVKIESIKSRSHGDDQDVVSFSYAIAPNRSSNFTQVNPNNERQR